MSETDDIRQRIQARVGQGEFLAGMLRVASKHSSDTQATFINELSAIAEAFRTLLVDNDLVRKVNYDPEVYWPSVRGKTFAFIDGGVANIELPSAAPVGIRVGSYIVSPGERGPERERFNIELALVDDLYSDDGVLYDGDFEDEMKLRDAARIIAEAAAAFRLASEPPRPLDAIILHGPLVNPVSPYGLDGFPAFGQRAVRTLLADADWTGEDDDRHFVGAYRDILDRLSVSGVPVAGAVERSIGKHPVIAKRILDMLDARNALKTSAANELESKLKAFGLNDATLLDVVLREGEYVVPLPVDRQGPDNKWPDYWKRHIRRYPKALTTYLKPAPMVLPFRLEMFEEIHEPEAIIALMLHTSRLLPTYGFPVGLDIVDKYAKVPSWMARGVRGQHQVVLLKKAVESGDPVAIAFAKRVLTAKGRDWLFRPSP